MKVLLLRPISATHIISPPVGLGYLASALRAEGHEVRILDCVKERLAWGELNGLALHGRPDLIGVQTFSCDVESVRRTLGMFKHAAPGVTTVIGGAHPSGAPERALLELADADYGIIGEAERSLPKLTAQLKGGKGRRPKEVPGLIWRKGPAVVSNPPVFHPELDDFAPPAWDLIDPRTYPFAPHQGIAKSFPIAPIVLTRGCPFGCAFCSTHTMTGTKIRKRGIDDVMKEIRLLTSEYGVKELHIEDDNFTASRDYVMEFCRRLIEGRLTVDWYCSSGVRLDTMDEELLGAMRKAGCYNMTVAIESGSQRVLDSMKKKLTLEDVREKVALINRCGFRPVGLFMLGFPGETVEDMEKTISFALSLDLKRAQFALFHPLPGSPVYDELEAKGELKGLSWASIKPSEVSYVPKGVTAEQLKALQKKAFLRFHLRPGPLLHLAKDITSMRSLFYVARRAFDYLKS